MRRLNSGKHSKHVNTRNVLSGAQAAEEHGSAPDMTQDARRRTYGRQRESELGRQQTEREIEEERREGAHPSNSSWLPCHILAQTRVENYREQGKGVGVRECGGGVGGWEGADI